MHPAADLDAAIVALVRRHGRQGINESVVWTMLNAQLPTLATDQCTEAVDRLAKAGRIYRHHRRRRGHIMLRAVPDVPAAAPAVVPPADLFGGGW